MINFIMSRLGYQRTYILRNLTPIRCGKVIRRYIIGDVKVVYRKRSATKNEVASS